MTPVDDLAGAVEDLSLAERIGISPIRWPRARLGNLADRAANDVRLDLDAGDPVRVLERIEELARHKIGGPSLRRTREIADALANGSWPPGRRVANLGWARTGTVWIGPEDLTVRGPQALALCGAACAVAAAKTDLETRQRGAASKVEAALYAACFSEGKWPPDSFRGRGCAGMCPRASGRATSSVSCLAADRGDRTGSRCPVAPTRRPSRPGCSYGR